MGTPHTAVPTSLGVRCCGSVLLLLLLTVLGIHSTTSPRTLSSSSYGTSFIRHSRRLHQDSPQRPAAAPAAAPSNTTQRSSNRTAISSAAGNSTLRAKTKTVAGSAAGNSTQPVCKWDPEDNTCTPTQAAWLSAGPGMPSSHYRRAVLMAVERERHCSQHTTAAECAADDEMRCFMQGATNASKARCASSDMEEMLLWSAKGFHTNISLIPHAMTCADSAARSFFDCYAFAAHLDACRARPQCTVLAQLGALRNICIPKSWLQATLGHLRKVFAGLINLDPGTYGTCGATCWLQEAKVCTNITAREACTAKPYCMFDEAAAQKANTSILMPAWDEDTSDEVSDEADLAGQGGRAAAAKAITAVGCRHQNREFSARNSVDQAALKTYGQCATAKTEAACIAVKVAASSAAVRLSSTGRRVPKVDWKSYVARDTGAKCVKALQQKAAGQTEG